MAFALKDVADLRQGPKQVEDLRHQPNPFSLKSTKSTGDHLDLVLSNLSSLITSIPLNTQAEKTRTYPLIRIGKIGRIGMYVRYISPTTDGSIGSVGSVGCSRVSRARFSAAFASKVKPLMAPSPARCVMPRGAACLRPGRRVAQERANGAFREAPAPCVRGLSP